MITPQNILRHEIIGLNAKITSSTHKGYESVGVIIGETKNTIKVGTQSGIKTVPKDCIELELNLPGGETVRLDGRLMISRPEERIKKKYRIKFV
jgi:ribonuclease P protein subunit POP4